MSDCAARTCGRGLGLHPTSFLGCNCRVQCHWGGGGGSAFAWFLRSRSSQHGVHRLGRRSPGAGVAGSHECKPELEALHRLSAWPLHLGPMALLCAAPNRRGDEDDGQRELHSHESWKNFCKFLNYQKSNFQGRCGPCSGCLVF